MGEVMGGASAYEAGLEVSQGAMVSHPDDADRCDREGPDEPEHEEQGVTACE
jgi:hypothetical protein